MNLIDIDFDERLLEDFRSPFTCCNFTEEELTELIGQADRIIASENEDPQEQASAYVKKYQLFTWQHKLAPKLLEKALALCPDIPQALIRMGLFFYLKDRDMVKLLEYINKVIETSPSYADARLFRAHLSSLSKEYSKQIISDCTEYSRLKPASSFGFEICANYLHSHMNKSVLFDIITVFSMSTEDNLGQYYKCFNNLFYGYENFIEKYCTEIINAVSSEKALYWFAYKRLAEYYCTQKNYNKSLSAYSSMIERNGNGSVFQLLGYSGRASVYKEIEDYDKALDDLHAIIEHGSWVTEEYNRGKENSLRKILRDFIPMKVHYDRGTIYRYKAFDRAIRLEMTQKAIVELSKAIEFAALPYEGYLLADSYMDRADLYKEISEFNNAIEDYSAVIKLDKKYNDYHLKSAYEERMKLYLKQGDKEKAFTDYVITTELSDFNGLLSGPEDLVPINYEVLNDVE
jgi:tetratricopeptide (TPR) repeat protein